jgi:hypothetical protein
MTRDDPTYSDVRAFCELVRMAIGEGYAMTHDSVIVTPGRFEGEHVSALYWDDIYMNGDPGDEYQIGDSHAVSWYELDADDARKCGQSEDNARTFARMEYTDQGFVYLRYFTTTTRADVDELNNVRNADRFLVQTFAEGY